MLPQDHARLRSPLRNNRNAALPRYLGSVAYQEEAVMPVLVMWAIPAVVVIGGAGYFLVHMH